MGKIGFRLEAKFDVGGQQIEDEGEGTGSVCVCVAWRLIRFFFFTDRCYFLEERSHLVLEFQTKVAHFYFCLVFA